MTRASRWSRATIALDLWRAERAGAPGLAARQGRRLAELVRFARARSPYFAALYRSLPEGPVELASLPPTRKPQLMARFDEWVTDPRLSLAEVEAHVAQPALVGSRLRGRYVVWSSSGTTGHPGRFLQDAGALAVYRALSTRIDRAWLGPRDWLALTRGGFQWTSVLATGGHFAGEAWHSLERARSRWRRSTWSLVPVQQPLERIVAALNEQAPALLTLYPSTALLLAAEQRAGRLRIKPALIELSGEGAAASEVALVADAFQAPIHQVYACSECLLVGADCREGWLHVNDDWAIVEPVDRELRPTPAGTASHTVLISNLANWVQPILRYDLGDSVVVNDRPCACGSPLTAIRVSGRRDDLLTPRRQGRPRSRAAHRAGEPPLPGAESPPGAAGPAEPGHHRGPARAGGRINARRGLASARAEAPSVAHHARGGWHDAASLGGGPAARAAEREAPPGHRDAEG